MSHPVLPGGQRPAPVGRDDVVDEVRQGLRGAGRVVLEGPPGIGKTTTLGAVLADVRGAGTTVLACSPAEAESDLPYAALADLVRPLVRHVDQLPGPQRVAVTSALLDAAPAAEVDERAVAAGVLALLARAARQPVLVAVDDAMWLDDVSARVLAFALRRIEVPVVLCVRSSPAGSPVPLGLGRQAVVVQVGPLAQASLCRMLDGQVGARMSRPTLERVADESGGNPLLAWELARAVLRLPAPPGPDDDLPVVDASMTVLTAATLDSLPPATIGALRLAALLTVPRPADLVAAGARLSDLDPAVAAGLVSLGPDRVGFTHPVYATAVRATLQPVQRRALHARLAAVVQDPDERARQLSRAHVDPDPGVADTVAAAAERQRARGAQDAAAGLFARAAALTPVGDVARSERVLAAARCRFDAGDLQTAAETAREVLATSDGDVAASALLLLADLRWYDERLDPRTPREIATRALGLAREGSVTAGRIHSHLAIFADGPVQSADHATAAVAIFEGLPDQRESLASALLAQFLGEARAGRPPRQELVDRALEIEEDAPLWSSGTVPAIWSMTLDRTDEAIRRLTWLHRHASNRGDESWSYEVLAHLVSCELLAGRLDAAADHLARLAALGADLDHDAWQQVVLAAELALRRGDVAAARDGVRRGVAGCSGTHHWFAWHFRLQQAQVDLHDGRPGEAAAAFAATDAELGEAGVVEWQWQRYHADWVEAACLDGDLTTATSVLADLVARHERLPRPSTALAVVRARVLVEHARGADVSGALHVLTTALDALSSEGVLVDRAAAAMTGGLVAAAAGDAVTARSLLTRAHDSYRRADATGHVARAAAALEAVRDTAPDADDVRRALRSFHRPAPLAASRLAVGETGETRTASVRGLLREGVERVFGESADEELLAAVLTEAYLTPGAGHPQAMKALHLSRTTYYRRLAEATDRLAAWVLDEHTRRHA